MKEKDQKGKILIDGFHIGVKFLGLAEQGTLLCRTLALLSQV